MSDGNGPAAGQRIGAYRVESLLGQGGMGEVLLAYDERLRRTVAIKRILVEKADETNRRRFLREARAVACLNHPNIVQIFDIFEFDGADCIVMENVEGQGLDDLLKPGPLDVPRALEFARDVADGLAEAHGKGLVHRDLKAANIRIAEGSGRVKAGRAKILDFGIALTGEGEETNQPGVIIGTPHAMSPEQTAGRSVDHRSDLFSFGIMLYEMLSGVSPFRDQDVMMTLTRVQRHNPSPIRELRGEVPDVVEALISQLLAKSPNQRPSDTVRIAEELARLAVLSSNGGGLAAEATRPQLSFVDQITLVDDGTLVDGLTLVDGVTLDGATLDGATLDGDDVPMEPAIEEAVETRVALRVLLRTVPVSEDPRYGEVARELMPRFNGIEVENRDGAFLILFERPADAARFAVAYHRDLGELQARIGVFLGEVDLARVKTGGAVELRVGGPARPAVDRLVGLAGAGQTLLNRPAFDTARRAAIAGLLADPGLRWHAHGTYLLTGIEEPVELCEVGFAGQAPLTAPADSDDGQRALVAGEEETVGWRPASGQPVPGRDGWELLDRLGEGGFGEVWLAIDHETGERRVFKYCFDATRVRALKREATLMRLLRENLGNRQDIGRLIDWDFENAPFFIETEYTEGGDLHQWVENEGGIENISMETRLELAAETADALAAAHSVGVLHKDIKPPNVLIRTDRKGVPHAVLVDFGIGVLQNRDELEGAGFTVMGFTAGETVMGETSTGTIGYMAPEVVEGKAATVQSDVYSLGVLIYQLVCGDLTRAVAAGWERDIADEVLRDDLAEFMDRRPDERPESAFKVAERLRTLEERRAVRIREEEARQALKLAQKRRRNAQRLAIFASIIAVVVVVFSFFVVRARNEAVHQREQAENMTRAAVASNQLSNKRTAEGNLLLLEVQEPETTPTALNSLHKALRNPVEEMILEGHVGEISNVFWHSDGKRILSSSWDRTARIWDADSGNTLVVMEGHEGELWVADWSPDETRVATASSDGTARVWDTDSGTQVAVMEGHDGAIFSLDWHPSGRQIVTASADHTIRVWEVATGQEIGFYQAPAARILARFAYVRWSPDGAWVATNLPGEAVHVWDFKNDTKRVLDGLDGPINCLAWSSDSRLVAFNGVGRGMVWDLSALSPQVVSLDRPTALMKTVAWSPDDRFILGAAANNATAHIWDGSTGQVVSRLEGHSAGLWDALWSPDGKWILTPSVDETVGVWRAQDGQLLTMLEGHSVQVKSADWSADGKRIVTGSDDMTLGVWSPFEIDEALVLRGATDSVFDIAWSPGGDRVAGISRDKTARIWDLEGRELVRLVGHTGNGVEVAWSPDGRHIGTTSWDRTARIWNSNSGDLIAILKGHESTVVPIVWSPDGQQVVTASHDGTIRLWEPETGELLMSMPTDNLGHEGKIHTAEWSDDGQHILTTATDTTARIWDVKTGKCKSVLAGHSTTIRAFWSPDSSRVLTFGYDGAAKIWDATTGELEADLVGHQDRLYTASWSPDGARVATGSWDTSARVWDSRTGDQLLLYENHEMPLRALAWSPDGKMVATADYAGIINVWSPTTGDLVASLLGHDDIIWRAAWSSDSRFLLTASSDLTARVWAVADDYSAYLRGRIRARSRRCLPAEFYIEGIGLTAVEARQRNGACAACVPVFLQELGSAERLQWQAHENAWNTYSNCLAGRLKDI